MAAVLTLMQEGDTSRDVYLFDTFEGMTSPTDLDKSANGISAQIQLDRDPNRRDGPGPLPESMMCARTWDRRVIHVDHVKYVQGPVEATIPSRAPAEPIALLRLDTDWYESTRHELAHLFPPLSARGRHPDHRRLRALGRAPERGR